MYKHHTFTIYIDKNKWIWWNVQNNLSKIFYKGFCELVPTGKIVCKHTKTLNFDKYYAIVSTKTHIILSIFIFTYCKILQPTNKSNVLITNYLKIRKITFIVCRVYIG